MEEEAKWESQFEKDMAELEELLAPDVGLPKDIPDLVPQQDEIHFEPICIIKLQFRVPTGRLKKHRFFKTRGQEFISIYCLKTLILRRNGFRP